MKALKFLVRVGLSYLPNGNGERREAAPGDIVEDLPPHGTGRCTASCIHDPEESSHAWLVEQGLVELVAERGGPRFIPTPIVKAAGEEA